MSIGVMHNNQSENFPKRVFFDNSDGSDDVAILRGEPLAYVIDGDSDYETINEVKIVEENDVLFAGVALKTVHIKEGEIGHLEIAEPGSIAMVQYVPANSSAINAPVYGFWKEADQNEYDDNENRGIFDSEGTLSNYNGRGGVVIIEDVAAGDNDGNRALRKGYLLPGNILLAGQTD